MHGLFRFQETCRPHRLAMVRNWPSTTVTVSRVAPITLAIDGVVPRKRSSSAPRLNSLYSSGVSRSKRSQRFKHQCFSDI